MTYDADLAPHLEGLNEPQMIAVRAKPGPLRVAAGPGSGKTRVVVARIAHLVRGGADPSRILAVTFTKMAADEMRTRLAVALGGHAKRVRMGTFHSMAAMMIRRLGPEEIGRTKDFTIYDEGDRKGEIRSVIREMNLEAARKRVEAGNADDVDLAAVKTGRARVLGPDVKRVVGVIDQARGLRLGPKRLAEIPQIEPADIEAFRRYEERLTTANALDFGLILCKALDMSESIRTGPEMATMFDHVFVDEFQDADLVQVRLAYFLARRTRSIMVVGDCDQSLYLWRGAERGEFLRFEREWGEATTTVKLERNYRSTGNIVAAGRALIAGNPGRVPTAMFTEAARGRPIRVVGLPDARAEAELVVGCIDELARTGTPLCDIAIFYRSKGLYGDVEESLRKKGIPYRLVKGLRFYDREHVKDAICWLRLAVNLRDDAALGRMVNVPARGMSDKLMGAIERWSRAHGRCLTDGVVAAADGLIPDAPKRSAKAATAFLALLNDLAAQAEKPPRVALATCLQMTGYRGALNELAAKSVTDGDVASEDNEDDDEEEQDDLSRQRRKRRRGHVDPLTPQKLRRKARRGLADIDSLISEMGAYEADAEPADLTVVRFLQHAALLSESDEAKGEKVQVMTVHASKGREYDHVFLIAMEENFFPAFPSIAELPTPGRSAMREAAARPDERAEGGRAIDEEERLCYVGLTRARKTATLTFARERFHRGEYKVNPRSRYVDALIATDCCSVEGEGFEPHEPTDAPSDDDHPWGGRRRE